MPFLYKNLSLKYHPLIIQRNLSYSQKQKHSIYNNYDYLAYYDTSWCQFNKHVIYFFTNRCKPVWVMLLHRLSVKLPMIMFIKLYFNRTRWEELLDNLGEIWDMWLSWFKIACYFCQAQPKPAKPNPQLGAEIALLSN